MVYSLQFHNYRFIHIQSPFQSRFIAIYLFSKRLWFTALSKLVNSLKETESLSSEQELDFLQTLLESKELNALVNVHSKVAKVGKDDRLAPLMSSSLQVCRICFFFNLCIYGILCVHITVFKMTFSSWLYSIVSCFFFHTAWASGGVRSIGTSVAKMSHIANIKGNFHVTTKTTFTGNHDKGCKRENAWYMILIRADVFICDQ